MTDSTLQVAISQASLAGKKAINQDFFGVNVPKNALQRMHKGITAAIADGVSSSQVSQVASETAVTSFLQDYYATPDAWTVKTSAIKVIQAINGWLFAQTRQSQYRFDKEKGYLCTFSALVLKSHQAHVFHSGDSRIYRLCDDHLECLTQDHTFATSEGSHYLTKALGIHAYLDLDYCSLSVSEGDVFVLATDGVYDYIDEKRMIEMIQSPEPWETKADLLVQEALAANSPDNLTVQLLRVESLPARKLSEWQSHVESLKPAPPLKENMTLDGYTLIRALHLSSRSQVFLAVDEGADASSPVVIKVPSMEMREHADHLNALLMEEWVARRLDNPHLIKAAGREKARHYLYTVMEYVPGQTLAQWMLDNPEPSLESVRDIIGQIAKGLQAMHRQEMVHQDVRPHNVMIDAHHRVTLIDLGATRIAGVSEMAPYNEGLLGTAQYSAPEYFMGELGSSQSDIFSLGVIAYQLLSGGRFPYGNKVAQTRSRRDQQRLRYQSLRSLERGVPAWMDFAIAKAVHVQPLRRYWEVSELVADLQRPDPQFLRRSQPPLMERNPVLFWQWVSAILSAVVVFMLFID